ncbi:MAG: flagellin FliC [Bdellovibrionales bacterium]|nr:flagellin FliC [Bdellovibrionales bacterium]
MSISILTNVDSLRAQRSLSIHTARLSETFERLSTGLRIVDASDDAAGLVLADSLRADQRIADAAIRNANDGISLISIADGALEEIGNLLTRMAELAEISANGIETATTRSSLQLEFEALASEVTRISRSTEFNDLQLLADSSTITLQVGLDSSANSQIAVPAVTATLESLALGSTADTLLYSLNAGTDQAGQDASLAALDAVQSAISLLSIERGTLGASESRLSVAVSHLSILKENFAQAESQIRDADVAFEAAELVRLQILRDASAAVLAQANQQGELALKLLG